jgi:pimeloyl-ACP methyl ester carboxylesterase
MMRLNRMETKAISMKATRCSLVRSKIVFNRRLSCCRDMRDRVRDDLLQCSRSPLIALFDRAVYRAAAQGPGAIRAGNGWYQTVGQDIQDLEAYPKRSVPVLGISGISIPFLKAFLDRYAQHATMIEFKATGHWIPEERPAETAAAILEFLGQP